MLLLRVLGDYTYDFSYYSRVQAFIYNVLRGSRYDYLHRSRGYKFFCFSNIFPYSVYFRDGDVKRLIISSPDEGFIDLIYRRIMDIIDMEPSISIGHMRFKLIGVKKFRLRPGRFIHMISATPIVVRIPEKFYGMLGIGRAKEKYIYWRSMYPVEAFLYMVERNLIKKYNQFYNTDFKQSGFIREGRFKKEVAVKLRIRDKYIDVIGSIWEFYFDNPPEDIRRILEFGMETGLGERNSYGLGFINIL